jgi:hypothetical protein
MDKAQSAIHSIANITVQAALAQALQQRLARIDAQMLLLHTLGRPTDERAWLITHDSDPLPPAAQQRFEALCRRRLDGEPVAYLTGTKGFYGLELQVDARVLDPRPDTETLVDWALEVLAPVAAPRVLDLGTGSGAIALALQKERPDARVLAVDASLDALTGRGWRARSTPSCPTRPTSPRPTRTWRPCSMNHCRRWPVVPMVWTTSAPSLPRPPHTWCRAAGCCWSMATTRPRPCARCCRLRACRPCKPAKTLAGIARCSGGQRPTVK